MAVWVVPIETATCAWVSCDLPRIFVSVSARLPTVLSDARDRVGKRSPWHLALTKRKIAYTLFLLIYVRHETYSAVSVPRKRFQMNTRPDFATPRLAEVVERLTPQEIDQLPFGVIGLDPEGVVRLYSKTEARLSGRKDRPTEGQIFFTDVAPCMNNGYFKGRIDKARRAGTLDISFSFIGDFADRNRELNVRVQSASDGGMWIFHNRSDAAETA